MPRSRIASAVFLSVFLGSILSGKFAAAQHVAGGGLTVFTTADGQEAKDTFAFSAVRHADGTVSGQAQLTARNDNTILFISHLEIDCMLFLDENTVILGGVTVLDSDPEFVGSTIAFVVRDNGEGAAAPPDEFSGVGYSIDFGFELDCDVAAFLIESGAIDLEDVLLPQNGNIQVRP